MEKRTFLMLFEKYLAGKATPEEERLLEEYYRRLDENSRMELSAEQETMLQQLMLKNIWEQIGDESKVIPMKPRRRMVRWYAAASIIVILSAGGYYMLHKRPHIDQVAQIKPGTFKNDALPGNKAILTLANGQQLAVTSIPAGHINNTNAQKTSAGALVYGQSDAAADIYNTLTVPRGGGKHELRLADGTLAVLDAGSSIHFPVTFNGKDRRVSVTGQVYFEVVHKASQPFYVSVGGQTIEDIGTHFNINAFDGTIKTTLIEGSIKVDQLVLKPGQQAIQQPDGKLSVLNRVDEEEVLAWKNGLFKFGPNTSLQAVMNQLSRWYDLEVAYEGIGKNYRFSGFVPRDSKLSEVCKILEFSGVKFSLDGKKMIVYRQ
jgi:transmembrane sensor